MINGFVKCDNCKQMLMVSEDQADPEVAETEEEDTGYIPTPKEVLTHHMKYSYRSSVYIQCNIILLNVLKIYFNLKLENKPSINNKLLFKISLFLHT